MASRPKNEEIKPIIVYEYTDYRCFLKDKFYDLNKKNPLFSYRSFSRHAGFASPGALQRIISGERNLGEEGARKIAKAFRLGERERRYFELLVKFNQATDAEEKDRYFRELSQNKKFIEAMPLAAAQCHLFSHWYYVAILELVRTETKEKKGAKWLQRHLNPPVGLVEIRHAIRELKELGLLEEKKGQLRRKETMIKTDDEVVSAAVTRYHTQMSELAARAVLKEDHREREFTTLTVITSEKGFQEAKRQLRLMRDQLHSTLEQMTDEPKTFVGHLNLQLFRLST